MAGGLACRRDEANRPFLNPSKTEFLKVQDYYTEKKLLGIISEDRDRTITALVRLRRDIADPEAALAWAKGTAWGKGTRNFEMDEDGELMEFLPPEYLAVCARQ